MKESRFFVLLVFFSLSALCMHGQSLNFLPDFIVKNDANPINISETTDNKYLIGGHFDHVNNEQTGNFIRITQSGNPDPTFARITVDGRVRKSITLPNGKILVGGEFSHLNGVEGSLFLLNSDGTIDMGFEPLIIEGSNNAVYNFEIQSTGKIVVVGRFDQDDYIGILRLDTDGTLDNTFTKFPADSPGNFNHLLIDGSDNIYFGGAEIYRRDPEGAEDENSFTIEVSPGFLSSPLAWYQDRILLVGSFTQVNGVNRKYVALVNTDGSVDPFEFAQPDFAGMVMAPLSTNGFAGITTNERLIVFDEDGAIVQTDVMTALGIYSTLFVDQAGNIIVFGGKNLLVNESPHPYSVRLKPDLTPDETFTCKPTDTDGISSIAMDSQGRILVASYLYPTISTLPEKTIFRLHSDGTPDDTFAPAVDTSVEAVFAVQDDDKILFWGGFGEELLRLRADGSVDESFQTHNFDFQSSYRKIKIKDNKIYVGGVFTAVGEFQTTGMVRLNMDGSVDQSFATTELTSANPTDFEFQSDGKIVVSGLFEIDGTTYRVIRLHANGALDDTFENVVTSSGNIYDLKIDAADRIYVGGLFDNIQQTLKRKIARLNPDGSLDATFIPNITSFHSFAVVHMIELLPDGNIAVGLVVQQQFNPKSALVVMDTDGNVVISDLTDFGVNSIVATSFFSNGTLFLGGRLFTEDNTSASALAYVNFDDVTDPITTLDAVRQNNVNVYLTWSEAIPNAQTLIIERSENDNTSFVQVGTAPSSAFSYLDEGVEKGSSYYYRVRASNSISEGPYSSEVFIEELSPQQTIDFPELDEKAFGDDPFELPASATSGLDISYTVSDPELASVNGNILTILGVGSVTITASQEGDEFFFPATPVEQTLVISKGAQTITFEELSTKTTLDEPFELIATASSGLDVIFESSNEELVSVSGNVVTINGPGEVELTASQPGNENYFPAEPVTRTLVIELVTGLNDDLGVAVQLYPNPSTGTFHVKLPVHFDNGTAAVYSLSGKFLKQVDIHLDESGVAFLDVSEIHAGTYVVRISNDTRIVFLRIVKV